MDETTHHAAVGLEVRGGGEGRQGAPRPTRPSAGTVVMQQAATATAAFLPFSPGGGGPRQGAQRDEQDDRATVVAWAGRPPPNLHPEFDAPTLA